jgi:hypothetical protein
VKGCGHGEQDFTVHNVGFKLGEDAKSAWSPNCGHEYGGRGCPPGLQREAYYPNRSHQVIIMHPANILLGTWRKEHLLNCALGPPSPHPLSSLLPRQLLIPF